MVLDAYRHGMFPMAESHDSEMLHWYQPIMRGVIPLDAFSIPRSLKRFMRDHPFTLHIDRDFAGTIRACASQSSDRPETWINENIIRLYTALHKRGYAHSVECWQDDRLVGGLYGLHLGSAFFGESMFSHVSNASKVALVTLVKRMQTAGFMLLDTQYINDHLRQFGALEIPHADYMWRLKKALAKDSVFPG